MVFLAYMILRCWIFERSLSIVDREGDPLKEEELLTWRRQCVLSCQAVSNVFRKSLKVLTNLAIPVSLRCCFPFFKCLLTLMLSFKIRSIPLFSQNSFNRELTFSILVLHAPPLGTMIEITIWFLFILRNDEVGSVWDNIFDVNQVHCFVLKPGMRGEYLMCIVLAKITELGGRLKCQQGDTSWVWYYLCAVVGSPQIPHIRGLVVSTAGSNCRNPSLIPGRAEDQSVNTSEVVNCLL